MMFSFIWDHHHVHQEPPRPPRPQEENWRTGGVLTGSLMSDLHETFRKASLGCSLLSETITSCVRNLHVLQDPRKRLGGQVESWQASWCHHHQVHQEPPHPPRLQEETWRMYQGAYWRSRMYQEAPWRSRTYQGAPWRSRTYQWVIRKWGGGKKCQKGEKRGRKKRKNNCTTFQVFLWLFQPELNLNVNDLCHLYYQI